MTAQNFLVVSLFLVCGNIVITIFLEKIGDVTYCDNFRKQKQLCNMLLCPIRDFQRKQKIK